MGSPGSDQIDHAELHVTTHLRVNLLLPSSLCPVVTIFHGVHPAVKLAYHLLRAPSAFQSGRSTGVDFFPGKYVRGIWFNSSTVCLVLSVACLLGELGLVLNDVLMNPL